MRTPEYNPEREDLTPHTTPEELIAAVEESIELEKPKERVITVRWNSTLKNLKDNIVNFMMQYGSEYVKEPGQKFLRTIELQVGDKKVGFKLIANKSDGYVTIIT